MLSLKGLGLFWNADTTLAPSLNGVSLESQGELGHGVHGLFPWASQVASLESQQQVILISVFYEEAEVLGGLLCHPRPQSW